MKRVLNAVLSLMVSAVLVVGLVPSFALADEGDAASDDTIALEEGGEASEPSESTVPSEQPEVATGEPAPAEGQEAEPDEDPAEGQDAPSYTEPEIPEPEPPIEDEGIEEEAILDETGGEDSLDPEEEEADDPVEEDADLESQSDESEEAYAILYTNGDLVFQRGDAEDPSKGKVRGKWTDFESTYYSALDSAPWVEMLSYVRSIYFVDTISPVSTWKWFDGCSTLRYFDSSNLDTSLVKNMDSMFSGCSSLMYLDLTGLTGDLFNHYLDGVWVNTLTGKKYDRQSSRDSEILTAGYYVKLSKHTITKKAGTGGKVELRSSTLYPYMGDEVVFRIIPSSGKELASFNVTYKDSTTGKTVKLVTGKGIVRRAGTGAPGTISEYAFTMPDCDVTINATFRDNTRTYAITKKMTGTGKAGSNLMFVGSDGKVSGQTRDKVAPTMIPKAGQTVYFKSVPAKGARLTKFNVTYSYKGLDGKTVDVKLTTGHGITSRGGGLYSFTMPCYPVTLTGEFSK